MKFINRCLFKFSANVIRDQIYEFDKSAISLSVRINSLKDFNDFQKLRDLKIHRIIYNLNDKTELMDFLAEHNDECIKKIFDPSFFIFRGVSVNIPTILRDGHFRKLEQKALLQICQHLFKLKTDQNKTQFQVFMVQMINLFLCIKT
ncbi:unnamed protein product [Paramecium primaurelia]|uniref:Uncharacterized protein n=1 Tax=Paramecium primaurelia TaxID=5886 RepID=A0A8S1MF67_PARPR|nr:unnamed protein product [Paramecium primaurelia]